MKKSINKKINLNLEMDWKYMYNIMLPCISFHMYVFLGLKIELNKTEQKPINLIRFLKQKVIEDKS